MDLQLTGELHDFRLEARSWITENAPTDPRPKTATIELRAFDEAWQRKMYAGGWSGIGWPTEYGGRGLTPVKQIIWYEELLRAGAPGHGVFGIGFSHAGPTLMVCGSEDQKREYLPRILRGETPWCQGFSEPEAGSDLAGLRTRGVIDGDDLVVTGSKTWTTDAHLCDYCALLVRTDSDESKHRGLTWVIMDMRLPGIDVRPIMAIDRYHHNCEVFLDEVRIPLHNVVGEINGGWDVALATLAAERAPKNLDRRLHLILLVDEIVERAREDGRLSDSAIAERIAIARAKASAMRSTAYHQASSASSSKRQGPETSAGHAFFVEFRVEVARLAVDVLGLDALAWNPWTKDWLDAFHKPIAGGTKDIQKNIIGERLLGLPR